MKYLSLFSGGSNDHSNNIGCILKRLQFLYSQNAKLCQPMAVRAENDRVFDGIFAAFSPWDNVMRVTSRFIPSATHAAIWIQSPKGFIPRPLIGINLLICKDIGFAGVPSSGHLAKILGGCCPLLFGLDPPLMPANKLNWTPLPIKFWTGLSTSTSAQYEFHLFPSVTG